MAKKAFGHSTRPRVSGVQRRFERAWHVPYPSDSSRIKATTVTRYMPSPDGGALNYVERGDGSGRRGLMHGYRIESVVHGSCCFCPRPPRLCGDAAGHGSSGKPGPLSASYFARDIDAFLDARSLDSASRLDTRGRDRGPRFAIDYHRARGR